MDRRNVVARIKTVEPSLRASGVGALFIFGSVGRDQARSGSDLDVFVDAADERFFDLSNYMGAYRKLRELFPQTAVGFTTREGLSDLVRPIVEREALRVF